MIEQEKLWRAEFSREFGKDIYFINGSSAFDIYLAACKKRQDEMRETALDYIDANEMSLLSEQKKEITQLKKQLEEVQEVNVSLNTMTYGADCLEMVHTLNQLKQLVREAMPMLSHDINCDVVECTCNVNEWIKKAEICCGKN
jgi:hypothetical protein